MYHLAGITPEADEAVNSLCSTIKSIDVDIPDLVTSWEELNSSSDENVDVICLGNPHFSQTECTVLSTLCAGRNKHSAVAVIVTLGRDVYSIVKETGVIDNLETFGVQFINDTCWCMIEEPIIPVNAKVLMTNSGKYAHYGPGLVNRPTHFGSLAECVDAACSAKHVNTLPDWLIKSLST